MIADELHSDGTLELTLDRPPVNAFSIGLINDLAARLEGLKDRADVRVVLLRSAGEGFCGGGDVKEVESLAGFEGILGQAAGSLRLTLAVLNCAVPVICAVHGYCVGVGVLVAASADLLIASAHSTFVLAEVDNGATAGGVQALRLMPEKRLRAAMMLGEPVPAEELHAMGSIYGIAATVEELAPAARQLAARIAKKSPEVMRRLKRSLNHSSRAQDLEAQYRAELSYTYELNIRGEASEGRKAFFDGERPSYRSR
jgi:enoyl-CoA hydratase